MHYVVIGEHTAEVCPMSNAKTRALLMEMGDKIPGIAEKHGVNLVSGPFVNYEHITVVIVETDRPENLDAFLLESRLPQWNQIRVIPSRTIGEGAAEFADLPTLY